MSELIDFKGATNMMMGLAQLDQQAQRTDLARQNLLVDQERIGLTRENMALQREQQQRQGFTKAYEEIGSFMKSPFYAGLPVDKKIELTYARGTMLQGVAGRPVPMPSKEEMVSAYESINGLLDSINGNDPKAQLAAMNKAAVEAPEWFSGVAKELRANGELTEQLSGMADKIELNKQKLQAITAKNSSLVLQQNFLSPHVSQLANTVNLTNDPKFSRDYQKMVSFENEESKQIYLQQHPDFARAFKQALLSQSVSLGTQPIATDMDLMSKEEALKAFLRKGETPPAELEMEVKNLDVVRQGQARLREFLDNPFSPDALKSLKTQYEVSRLQNGAIGQQMGNLAKERTQILAEKKFDSKEMAQQNLADAQVEFGQLDTDQQTPQMAAKIAGKYKGVLPKDVLEATKNPNHALVNLNMKQETEESKQVGEGFGKQYMAIQNAAVSSNDHLAKLNRMEQLLSGMQTGALTPSMTQIQSIADSIGFTVDKSLPAKQAFESLSNEIALSLRNPSGGAGMPGAMSDKDREFLQAMTPGLSKTKEGNQLIIDSARAIAKRSQEVAKMARAYRKKNGHFDEGFLDDLQSYADAHPMFTGKAIPNGEQVVSSPPAQPSVNPYSDADKEARYQEWKRRQGQ